MGYGFGGIKSEYGEVEIFAFLFSFSRGACGALVIKGGGNRLKTVGYDVGILHDLVGVGALGAPADISAQRKFVIWLANKVRETNLFSSFGYGEKL